MRRRIVSHLPDLVGRSDGTGPSERAGLLCFLKRVTETMDGQVAESLGQVEQLIALCDWSKTSLGPMPCWPGYVQSTIALAVGSALPMVTLWGLDGVVVYNDAYARLFGRGQLPLFGASVLDAWVMEGGRAAAEMNHQALRAGLAGQTRVYHDEQMVSHRGLYAETIWVDVNYQPIRDHCGHPVGVLGVVHETTERVKLERQRAADGAALLAAQLRHDCLAELGARLRGCHSPEQISGAVSDILGRVLGCTRTGYAVIDGEYALIRNDWTNGTVASLSGRHPFLALGGAYLAHIQSGEILIVPDVQSHPVIADSVERWLGLEVRAFLNVPLLDNGRLVGLLYAHQSRPRAWACAEVSLVKEVADRTWEAMGRARAVEALRHLNQSLEEQIRERTLQRDRMWMLSTDIMMVTTREGAIISVNPAWSRLLGWGEEELIGTSFYSFIHPDDVAPTRSARRKLEHEQLLDKLENRYRTKAGGFVWLSWKAVPDGDVVHSVARDVTAEREQADALRAAEEALRQAQKMEAVGQLTGGIAHDFNNLLQGILGSLALAQKRLGLGQIDGLAEYHGQAIRSAERASALVQRLLAFSRRQTLDPRPVNANSLVMAMEPLLRRTIGEAICLTFDLEAELWTTLCDANQLDSAILNLAINARDAMPHGGTLTISSRNIVETGQVCVAVADTGTGMAPDVVERVFEPFYTTKPIGQGTGLGLSMVYGFMRQSGGEAKIESAVGHGTVVKLLLPRYAGQDVAEVVADVAALGAEQAAVRGQGAVLVLEDEFLVRLVIVEVLEELGFKIIEAEDGPSGLAILQSSRDIDLLVTDIGLPGLNGRQVAEAARLLRPTLKILFMTGYADTSVMSDGFLAPGMEMISKPFEIETLSARVRQMIAA